VVEVKRLMEVQKESDYYALFMNEETSLYLLRISAIKEIMNSPNRYGFEVHDKYKYELTPTKKLK
jgi:hypothetical protein